MIVKFFPHKKGNNPKASIDYLLKKQEGLVRTLSGDPRLSQKIAEGLSFKNKYTVGCLSFEEANIPENQKFEMMAEFERMIFQGLDEDQYNISWIEHTDKGRLELNFFIPNVELTTGKRFYTYYDKADRKLVDSFKRLMNGKYNLTNPDAPEKRQAAVLRHDLPKGKKEIQKFLNDHLMDAVENGIVKNRNDILKRLEGLGLEIARSGKDYISIKSDGQNIRLKGAIYDQSFTATGTSQTVAAAGRERVEATQGDIEREYDAFSRKRNDWNQKRYGKAERSNEFGNVKGIQQPDYSSNQKLPADEDSNGSSRDNVLCSSSALSFQNIWLKLKQLEQIFEQIQSCFRSNLKAVQIRKEAEAEAKRQEELENKRREELQRLAEIKRIEEARARQEKEYQKEEILKEKKKPLLERLKDIKKNNVQPTPEPEIDDDDDDLYWDNGPSM